MATTLPRMRQSDKPPASALPALPMAKTRKSTGGIATPRKSLRSPSTAVPSLPTLASASTTALPTSKSTLATPAPPRTLRKAVSISSFPHPPSRMPSLPPSPLSGSATPSRKPRTPQASKLSTSASGNPSLLNGSGESKLIRSAAGSRVSDGLISIGSPTQSRSSSAQDSYSTSATTFDEPVDQSMTPTNDKRTSKGLDGKGNVLVSVRVRPDAGGNNGRSEGEWMVDGRRSLVAYRGKEGGDYFYDNVFSTHDDNSRVYDHSAKRLVRRVMEGYHGTVFAYGMTGTGKTFSMQGTASSPGVIPLAITDIFSYIRETPSREFLLRVSYLEIYNEKIHDLLSMGVEEDIKLREDSKRGVYATPLKEEIVQSPTQLLRVIARGDQARRTASTQFNARSSRSHAVVQIVVESRERTPGAAGGDSKRAGVLPGGVRVSTLSLIDLAGSEKAAETKERRQEGSHINKSLLTLGTVISRLSEHKDGKSADKDGKHLPYRDSKLTRLLQGALSGNSLVSILCTIATGAAGSSATTNTHIAETINTLKFASRAKNNIVSHAKRAEEALGVGGEGGARVLLERYRMEILELRGQLETQSKNQTGNPEDALNEKDEEEERAREKEQELRHEEQILEMQLARTALKERIEHLNRLILSSKSSGVNASGTYSALGIHPRYSISSLRSSNATSVGKPGLERSGSLASSASTIGRKSIGPRQSSDGDQGSNGDDEGLGEYGDGMATLQAQNQALQSDLADKTRYIATLEKRLLQARRASSGRTSLGFAAPSKSIMVGEDHSVSTLLKDKDSEIAELRARLEDKDRMLAALRSAARSRDAAEGVESPRLESLRSEARLSLLHEGAASPPPTGALPDPPAVCGKLQPAPRKRTKSVDEMSRILDEMIQDRVETGHIVRGSRGSVRVVADRRSEGAAEHNMPDLEPLRETSQSPGPHTKSST
ncbi:kinesin motor domain-domain-containing protein [Microdochium bolleyi]|uniref:Kinesin-like protein n=1 Tax=Microdochium bolleyi TaxID=196109 RepID=A0A136JEA0_9PEZI|nr:kinesin motor domain-domain-containing protein [Microdochium bolleyi]